MKKLSDLLPDLATGWGFNVSEPYQVAPCCKGLATLNPKIVLCVFKMIYKLKR